MDTARTDFGTRLIQALVAGIAAVLTLAAYPIVISFIGAKGAGAIGAMEISAWVVKLAFSKVGLAFIGLSVAAGFLLSPERMANGFSFLWGTHPFWAEADEWFREHVTPELIAFTLVVVAAIVIWWRLY